MAATLLTSGAGFDRSSAKWSLAGPKTPLTHTRHAYRGKTAEDRRFTEQVRFRKASGPNRRIS
jgi:hypothetical protein